MFVFTVLKKYIITPKHFIIIYTVLRNTSALQIILQYYIHVWHRSDYTCIICGSVLYCKFHPARQQMYACISNVQCDVLYSTCMYFFCSLKYPGHQLPWYPLYPTLSKRVRVTQSLLLRTQDHMQSLLSFAASVLPYIALPCLGTCSQLYSEVVACFNTCV